MHHWSENACPVALCIVYTESPERSESKGYSRCLQNTVTSLHSVMLSYDLS